MEKKDKPLNQFCRNDGYNPSVKCDDPIQQKWIHKQVVKKVGEGEDDFIIEEKPVLIDEINLQKQIDEEAKTTDLKYLLKQLLLTGDESLLNQRPGFYGDITGIQTLMEGGSVPTASQIQATLPQELQSLSTAQLASMTDEDILKYITEYRKSVADASKGATEPQSVEKEGN